MRVWSGRWGEQRDQKEVRVSWKTGREKKGMRGLGLGPLFEKLLWSAPVQHSWHLFFIRKITKVFCRTTYTNNMPNKKSCTRIWVSFHVPERHAPGACCRVKVAASCQVSGVPPALAASLSTFSNSTCTHYKILHNSLRGEANAIKKPTSTVCCNSSPSKLTGAMSFYSPQILWS